MPVAFLFNRKVVGADEKSLADALAGCSYAIVSPCYEQWIFLQSCGDCMQARNSSKLRARKFASSGDPHQTILEVRARQQTGEDGI